jgi:integrase
LDDLKHEIDLTSAQLGRILALAEKEDLEHFCLFGLYTDYGLRRAEPIGGDQKGNRLPGIMIEDIKWNDAYVWLTGKGYGPTPDKPWRKSWESIPVSPILLARLKEFVGRRRTGKLFQISHQTPNNLMHKYARMIGIEDWPLAHPHRIRHWFHGIMSRRLGVPISGQPLNQFEFYDIERHDRTPLGVISRYVPATPLDRRRTIVQAVLAEEGIPLL